MLTERTTPARLGWAVGVGVLIGALPVYGLHLAMCLTVATILGLNRAITYAAAHVSLPWFIPLLIFGSVQLGSIALTGEWLPISMESLRGTDPWSFGGKLLVGSVLLGVVLGVPAGLVSFVAMRAYRQGHPLPPDPIGDQMQAVAQHYRAVSRFAFGYVRGKFNSDPAYRQLAERMPMQSPVLDVGCGRGQTLLLLALLDPKLTGVGLDWDLDKVQSARQVAKGLARLQFQSADADALSLPEEAGVGTILLIDVLHYSPPNAQDALLRRAARAVRPGGSVYVRELDLDLGWRARVTQWQEKAGRALRLNRGKSLSFRRAKELVAVLESEGLEVEVVPSWGDLPLANVMLAAHRPEIGRG